MSGMDPAEAEAVIGALRPAATVGAITTSGYDRAVVSALFTVAGMPGPLLRRLRDQEGRCGSLHRPRGGLVSVGPPSIRSSTKAGCMTSVSPEAVFGLLTSAVAVAVVGFAAGRRCRRPARLPPAPGDSELWARLTVAQRLLDEARARVADLEGELDRARRNLVDTQAEALRISSRAKRMTDRTEAEMGRLESAAIIALESMAASHRAEVADLREQLTRAQDSVHTLQAQLDGECQRASRLESALAERDRLLAAARADARDRTA